MKSILQDYQVRKMWGDGHHFQYLFTHKDDERSIKNTLPLQFQIKMETNFCPNSNAVTRVYDFNQMMSLVPDSEEEILNGFIEEVILVKGSKEEQEILNIFEEIQEKKKKSFKYSIERGKSEKFKTWVLFEKDDFDLSVSDADFLLNYFFEKFCVVDYSYFSGPINDSYITIDISDSENYVLCPEKSVMDINEQGQVTIFAKDFQRIINVLKRKEKIALALNKEIRGEVI